jgi:predicted oxidoreductase
MHILYFDEAGDLGLFVENSPSKIQLIFALKGIIVPQANVAKPTSRLMALKLKHFGLSYPKNAKFELLRYEIKGKNIRRDLRKSSHALAHLHFIDDYLASLKSLDYHLQASQCVKGLGFPFDGEAV